MLLLPLLGASGLAHAATILVYGDSLSAGYGIDAQAAWPVLLGKKLRDSGYRYEVVNVSISGETTAGGLSRFPKTLGQHKPAIVIIELGANDGLRGLSLKAMHDNLEAMVQSAKKAGAKVVLVGMRMPPNFGQSYTEKFHATYADLAKAQGTALVPYLFEGFGEKRDMFVADGLHPKAEAQPIILDTIWPALRPLLKKG